MENNTTVLPQILRTIQASDGVELATYVYGDYQPHRQTILVIHGFPDDHHVWDEVVGFLKAKRDYNVISYDVRGAGKSEAPQGVRNYSLAQLAADIDSVINAYELTSLHIVAHDWGSIQSWQMVYSGVEARENLHKISSYTSISGPDLNMAGKFLQQGRKRVGWKKYLRQCLGSSYIPFFRLPFVPVIAIRLKIVQKVLAQLARINSHSSFTKKIVFAQSEKNYLHGLNLYRANMPQPFVHPQIVSIDTPVHLIVPSGDIFVTPAVQVWQAEFLSRVKISTIEGGHWVVAARPELIADTVIQGIEELHIGAKSTTSSVLASKTQIKEYFDPVHNKLALITGGASGIGRCIALELARRGIGAIIIVDRDNMSAQETCALLQEQHTPAYAYSIDISDPQAVEELAKNIYAKHGVIDILFNNAGIGMAGRFLETSTENFDKIMGVNLLGVINCCRIFGQQMVKSGKGGSIINIASASAFLPSKSMVAYSTTKAAVLGFSASLRADFLDEGIKVTTVCPGFVNTNIAKNTIYAGMTEQEQEKARAKAASAYKKRNYTPEKTAKIIVKALYSMPPLVIISPEAKIMYFFSKIFPPFIRRFARLDIRLR